MKSKTKHTIKLAFALLFAFALVVTPIFCARAEEALGVDVTNIVVAAIALLAAVLSSVIGYVAKKHVIPWLKQKNLVEAASIVVNAVEALIGRGMGEQKWELAVKKMQEMGWNVHRAPVLDALRAAWKALDLKQYAAGEKYDTAEPFE